MKEEVAVKQESFIRPNSKTSTNAVKIKNPKKEKVKTELPILK